MSKQAGVSKCSKKALRRMETMMTKSYTWAQRQEMGLGWIAAQQKRPFNQNETIGWKAGFHWHKRTKGQPLPEPKLTLSEEFSQLRRP